MRSQFGVLLVCFWLTGCLPTLHQQYMAAVQDAAEKSPDDQYNGLTPPVADTKGIVRVVTWEPITTHVIGTKTTKDWTWITLDPYLQKLCKAYKGPLSPSTRIFQAVGMFPNVVPHEVAVMDVNLTDLRRPCWSTDTSTPECPVKLAKGLPYDEVSFLMTQSIGAYWDESTKFYPWTHYGYTYDWNSGTKKYGLSEYVVKPGSSVKVVSTMSAADYCK